MSVGARLYSLRVHNSLSTEELADKLGVAKNTIYRWERNFFAPTKPKLLKLAELYGVSVDWILKGIEAEGNELEKKLNIPNRPTYFELPGKAGERGQDRFSSGGLRDEACTSDEYRMLAMYKRLPLEKKYHLLGYLERMYVEEFKIDYIAK